MTKHSATKFWSNKCDEQFTLFRIATMFFTRIPVGKIKGYSDDKLSQSNRYFSTVGLLLAIILALFSTLLDGVFSNELTVALLIAFSLLLTGAFHEDGLADMADGIGGGYSVEKRLAIMKDSRIGTYGSVTLVTCLLIKFYALVQLIEAELLLASLLLGYSLSRGVAASLIYDTDYVSEESLSKSKPLATQQSTKDLLICLVVGSSPVMLFSTQDFFFSLAATLAFSLLLLRWFVRRWLISRIGGYTGDCLGAVQQITELVIYLSILAMLGQPS